MEYHAGYAYNKSWRRRMKKTCLIAAVFVFSGYAMNAYTQQRNVDIIEECRVLTVKGTIKDIDAQELRIEITLQNGSDSSPQEEVVFHVPQAARIFYGTREIHLYEVRNGDPVTVQYYYDKSGMPTIVSMVIDT